MFLRIGLVLSALLVLVDIETLIDPGPEPVMVTVLAGLLGALTLVGVLGYRRLPVPALITVIVSRVLDGLLSVGGLIAVGHIPVGVRMFIWVFLALTVVAVALVATGLTARTRVRAHTA